MVETLAIVGVGLLGGSIALAARERGLAKRIIGIARQPQSLDIALQRRIIDEGYLQFDDALHHTQYAIVCTPVDQIAPLARELLDRFPDMIVSDVGSTKASIVSAIDHSPALAARFLGGHPLAGSEKSGPEHADASLFQDKLMFLTPSETSKPDVQTRLKLFWEGLGCRVVFMSAVEHDDIMAMTSHLPHLASFALAGTIPAEYLPYSGTGLRSMTRLAGGDPEMWRAIVQHNREAILTGLTAFDGRLKQFHSAVEQSDTDLLLQLFHEGRRTHHALGS
jgi:prephenate dehydrogenase